LAGAVASAAAPPARLKGAKPTPRERPNVFLGYSFTQAGSANLNGGHVSASYPLWRSLSLVGDLSGHYGSFAGADLSQYELLAGVRRYWHSNRIRPFAEVLAGGVRHEATVAASDATLTSTGTDLALCPGFGADYRLTRTWAARAVFDLLLVRGGGWEADPRLSLGAVYRFGRP
jgi:hypothetical protein